MYQDYLIKIGSQTIPNKKIISDSYSVLPLAREVIDEAVTADGVHHYTFSNHERTQIEFTFCEMKDSDMRTAIGWILNNLSDQASRSATVTYYNPLDGNYKSGSFRVHDFLFGTKRMKGSDLWYSGVAVTLEEY